MRCARSSISSSPLPSRTLMASVTSCAYSSFDISPTHGAEQRLIWYCRHGRERFAKNVSLHGPQQEQLLQQEQRLARRRAFG